MRPSGGRVAANEGEESVGYVDRREPSSLVQGIIVSCSIVAMAAVATGSQSRGGELCERGILAGGRLRHWSNCRIVSGLIVVQTGELFQLIELVEFPEETLDPG